MSEKNVYVKDKGGSKFIFWMFFAIIAFIAFFFPFIQPNLRYQTGTAIGGVMDILGNLIWTFGPICLIFGAFGLFCSRGGGGTIKTMVLGYLMIMIGQWLMGPNTTPFTTNSDQIPIGYHALVLILRL